MFLVQNPEKLVLLAGPRKAPHVTPVAVWQGAPSSLEKHASFGLLQVRRHWCSATSPICIGDDTIMPRGPHEVACSEATPHEGCFPWSRLYTLVPPVLGMCTNQASCVPGIVCAPARRPVANMVHRDLGDREITALDLCLHTPLLQADFQSL